MDDQLLMNLARRGFESRDLDFKGPVSWDTSNKRSACEIVKDVLALANTTGGYLIIGVSEADGIFNVQGLSPQQAASWESTKVNNFLANYVDPPINVLTKVFTCDGVSLVALRVPQFTETPHICIKEYPDVLSSATLYVRTTKNESAPISEAADLRLMVERAIRTRQDHMLEAMRSIMIGAEPIVSNATKDFENDATAILQESHRRDVRYQKGARGYLITVMHPAVYSPKAFLVVAQRNAVRQAMTNFRGWPFVFADRAHSGGMEPTNLGLRMELQDLPGHCYDFWETRDSGLLVHRRMLMDVANNSKDANGNPNIDPRGVVYHATEAIDALVKYYRSLGVTGIVRLQIRLEGINGRTLAYSAGSGFFGLRATPTRLEEVDTEMSLPLDEWIAGLADHAVELSADLFTKLGWEGKPQIWYPHVRDLLSGKRS